jgi:hypothetical protein
MPERDLQLLGNRVTILSQQNVRYTGILFSLQRASQGTVPSIVLHNGLKSFGISSTQSHCLVMNFGTEDRLTDTVRNVAASSEIIPSMTFMNHEIKDLYVHDDDDESEE